MENSLNYKYGLKQVINASGRMSILGVSSPTDTVMDAMKFGGQNYVEIADLVDKSGQYIAQKIKAEDAVVVKCLPLLFELEPYNPFSILDSNFFSSGDNEFL